MSNTQTLNRIKTLKTKGELDSQDVHDAMTYIKADMLRHEKYALTKLSDEVYGHVDRKDLNSIQSRIDDINDWLSHLEYV